MFLKRLFIAVPVSEQSRKQIISGFSANEQLRKLPMRWTSEQNLHLTLQFLGNVEEKRIPVLKQILNRISPPPVREELFFTGIGAFPNAVAPKIIWIGIKQNDYLLKIQALITQDLIRNGFEADRKKYKPHLTLARVKDGFDLPAENYAFLKELRSAAMIDNSPLDRITLFESRLQPGGPLYTSVYEKNIFG